MIDEDSLELPPEAAWLTPELRLAKERRILSRATVETFMASAHQLVGLGYGHKQAYELVRVELERRLNETR